MKLYNGQSCLDCFLKSDKNNPFCYKNHVALTLF
jgi:hypothetical protein